MAMQGERRWRHGSLWLLGVCLLAGCGGGGGGSGPAPAPPAPQNPWVAGTFLPAASFAGRCVAPRSGINPQTLLPYIDVQGNATAENNWLRSWNNHLYLWYDEVVDRDPALYTTSNYFDLLRTTATTTSGTDKDKFHYTYPTAEWLALSQGGVSVSYGIEWAVVASLPPRRIVVAYTEPGSPATAPGVDVQRGYTVVAIDGIDVVNTNDPASIQVFVDALYPDQDGETHTFRLEYPQIPQTVDVTLQAAVVVSTPVRNVQILDTNTGPVGYVLFNDHLATAEQGLVNAFQTLQAGNVTDLVLDVRYNGGGYLDIANQLSYMIAGTVPTAGQTFEALSFNAKHTAVNPVTGAPLTPDGFHTTTVGFSLPPGQPLPTLNLPRVYMLTGSGTCSASESIINGLRGVNVEVIQIGSRTCGKPYGFYPADNCGTTYFSIQFRGVNAAGFGDYTDGFTPNNAAGAGTPIPGCSVGDDFNHALGDPAEARFAAALTHRVGQSCPAPSGMAGPHSARSSAATLEDALDTLSRKSPFRENRVLRTP